LGCVGLLQDLPQLILEEDLSLLSQNGEAWFLLRGFVNVPSNLGEQLSQQWWVLVMLSMLLGYTMAFKVFIFFECMGCAYAYFKTDCDELI
jgi:hypothetical protein